MRRFTSSSLALALTVFVAAGCSGGQPDDSDSGTSAGSFGLMSVTYDHNAASADGAATLLLNTRAQFVRYTAMDRDHVSRLLALPLDPTRDVPPIDTCKTYDVTLDISDDTQDRATKGRIEQGHVELLEAGRLRVKTESGTVQLTPKHFATLLPFISGVTYGEAQSTQERRLGTIKVTSAGGETVGAFVIRAATPQLPALLAIDGAAPTTNVTHDRSQALSLRWRAQNDAAAAAKVLTYVELRYTRGKRELALRCRPRDDGHFQIPASALEGITGSHTLEVVRLRRAAFSADGLDQAELRISVRELAGVTFK